MSCAAISELERARRARSSACSLALVLGVVACGLAGAGCGDDDDSGGVAGDGATQSGSGGAGHHASGSGGTQGGGDAGGTNTGGGKAGTGTGNAGSGGSGGAGSGGAGAGASGSGSAGSSADAGAGTVACNIACVKGKHCELVQVTCVRAPCPPQPSCVDDAAAGGSCGSRGLAPCAADEFCNFSRGAMCGDADSPGTCSKIPQACDLVELPVCGCDGQTYSNECAANAAGASVRSDGECSGSASGAVDCDPRKILCKRVAPACAEGYAPSVDGSCYGACVPIEMCPCQGPEACPNPDKFTCHMAAAHCGPFV